MSQPEKKAHSKKGTHKTGVVTSDAMDKTVSVKVVTPVRHRMYHRIVRRTSKFMAHDPENRCKTGDTVEIRECRPLSKNKRWKVTRIVRASEGRELGGAAGEAETSS